MIKAATLVTSVREKLGTDGCTENPTALPLANSVELLELRKVELLFNKRLFSEQLAIE
jgi:hypothetical protein